MGGFAVAEKGRVISGNELQREFKKEAAALSEDLEKELKAFFDAMDGTAARLAAALLLHLLAPTAGALFRSQATRTGR